MKIITFDNELHLDGGRNKLPSVRADGFRAKPRYIHLVHSLGYREDAGETAVIQRALDYVEARATEVMYPELRALRFFPTLDAPLGARTFTFAVKDKIGRAKRTSGAGGDLPRANLALSENTSAIAGYGAMYAYTTDELRAFQYANANGRGPSLSIDTERGDIAMEMIARVIDSTVAFGDADDTRINGLVNNANVTVSTSAVTWSTATFDQLLAELMALANNPIITSKETFRPDTILLPTAQWMRVSSVYNPLGTKSVLEVFNDTMRAMGRNVTVESWPVLAKADAAGTGPRAMSYVKDTKVLGAIVPALFIAQPPQAHGLEWQIPCEGVCGGGAVKAPLGVYYRDGLEG